MGINKKFIKRYGDGGKVKPENPWISKKSKPDAPPYLIGTDEYGRPINSALPTGGHWRHNPDPKLDLQFRNFDKSGNLYIPMMGSEHESGLGLGGSKNFGGRLNPGINSSGGLYETINPEDGNVKGNFGGTLNPEFNISNRKTKVDESKSRFSVSPSLEGGVSASLFGNKVTGSHLSPNGSVIEDSKNTFKANPYYKAKLGVNYNFDNGTSVSPYIQQSKGLQQEGTSVGVNTNFKAPYAEDINISVSPEYNFNNKAMGVKAQVNFPIGNNSATINSRSKPIKSFETGGVIKTGNIGAAAGGVMTAATFDPYADTAMNPDGSPNHQKMNWGKNIATYGGAGAAIGSVAGPWGTVIGGAAGILAGAGVSAFGGKKIDANNAVAEQSWKNHQSQIEMATPNPYDQVIQHAQEGGPVFKQPKSTEELQSIINSQLNITPKSGYINQGAGDHQVPTSQPVGAVVVPVENAKKAEGFAKKAGVPLQKQVPLHNGNQPILAEGGHGKEIVLTPKDAAKVDKVTKAETGQGIVKTLAPNAPENVEQQSMHPNPVSYKDLPHDAQQLVYEHHQNPKWANYPHNYYIYSKENSTFYVLNNKHMVIDSIVAGRGMSIGDTRRESDPTKSKSLNKGKMTTPGGAAVISSVQNTKNDPDTEMQHDYGTPLFNITYNDPKLSFNPGQPNGAMHGPYKGEYEERMAILNNPKIKDKLMSWGCINVPKATLIRANPQAGDSIFVTHEPMRNLANHVTGGTVADDPNDTMMQLINGLRNGSLSFPKQESVLNKPFNPNGSPLVNQQPKEDFGASQFTTPVKNNSLIVKGSEQGGFTGTSTNVPKPGSVWNPDDSTSSTAKLNPSVAQTNTDPASADFPNANDGPYASTIPTSLFKGTKPAQTPSTPDATTPVNGISNWQTEYLKKANTVNNVAYGVGAAEQLGVGIWNATRKYVSSPNGPTIIAPQSHTDFEALRIEGEKGISRSLNTVLRAKRESNVTTNNSAEMTGAAEGFAKVNMETYGKKNDETNANIAKSVEASNQTNANTYQNTLRNWEGLARFKEAKAASVANSVDNLTQMGTQYAGSKMKLDAMAKSGDIADLLQKYYVAKQKTESTGDDTEEKAIYAQIHSLAGIKS